MSERYPLAPRADVSMRTRDGVRLDAHVFRPAASGRFPVLLMRQPYGRTIASTVTYAHPSWYASHGYIVAIQDVRGRGTSEGSFRLLADETRDGHDSVEWAANLEGSSGAVGMYGFSYQAMTQYFAAAGRHPALKALSPAMGAWELHRDMAYEGGSLRLLSGISWAIQLGVEGARHAADDVAQHELFRASRAVPIHDDTPAWPDILRRHARYTHWGDWIAHPEPDAAYWAERSPRTFAAELDLPILHIGGWFDPMLTGTLSAYRHFAARGRALQKLVVGPWPHIPWGSHAGTADFGPAAARSMDRLQLEWFDRWLKGEPNGIEAEPPVSLFELGANRWRELPAWPAAQATPLYLSSDGLAATDPDSGVLRAAPAAAGADTMIFDPWRPVPTTGGHLAHPAGPANRAAVDQRFDVLTFTTPPFAREYALAGDVAAEIHAEADQPSYDLSCVLSEVKPDGRVLTLTEGYARVDSLARPIRVAMRAVAARLPPGSALRLSIQPCSFPAHAINDGSGQSAATSRLADQRLIAITVRHGAEAPSRLLVPELRLMRVLVIYAHPNPESYNAAVHQAVLRGLRKAGHDIDDFDLYAEGFDPVMSREERAHYHDLALNRKPVARNVERLLAAEAVVFVFPTWSFGPPAILKGWFDRTLIPGVSFKLVGGKATRNLSNIRAVAGVVTYGRPWWLVRLAVGDLPRNHILRYFRRLSPGRVKRRWLAHYDMNNATPKTRTRFLAKVEAAMSRFG